MDYSSLANLKAALNVKSGNATDDALMTRLITAVSRAIDRHCTGSNALDAQNYFMLQDVSDEVCQGAVNLAGYVVAFPHKPVIQSVTAFAYRVNVLSAWNEVALTTLDTNVTRVTAMVNAGTRGVVSVKVSYRGGYGESLDELPADLVEMATALAARWYREDEAGLNDAIGLSEIGTMYFTKAIPARIRESLDQFKRMLPW